MDKVPTPLSTYVMAPVITVVNRGTVGRVLDGPCPPGEEAPVVDGIIVVDDGGGTVVPDDTSNVVAQEPLRRRAAAMASAFLEMARTFMRPCA